MSKEASSNSFPRKSLRRLRPRNLHSGTCLHSKINHQPQQPSIAESMAKLSSSSSNHGCSFWTPRTDKLPCPSSTPVVAAFMAHHLSNNPLTSRGSNSELPLPPILNKRLPIRNICSTISPTRPKIITPIPTISSKFEHLRTPSHRLHPPTLTPKN